MVYHAWLNPMLLWDLLVCRAVGVAFVTHCHSVFSQPARRVGPYFAAMPPVYHLCDSVVTLSEVDSTYWSNFNDNVISVANPLTFDLDDVSPSELSAKTVLWLGRMSNEKRPHEALQIFAKVLEGEPDAKLLMVGSNSDEAYMGSLNELIRDLGIGDSVDMCGFQKDVRPFYSEASVYLMTSDYEGYSMTLSESQSAGIPCVMYDLPYLTLTRPKKGFVAVELGDIDAAADAVVDLLRDPDYRRSLGREARANVEDQARFDLAGTWRQAFESLARPVPEKSRDENTRIMWETLFEHYSMGAEYRKSEVVRLKREAADARRKAAVELRRIRSSRAFRIGRVITSIPRQLRKALKRVRYRGDGVSDV
jgi:glycosyltransferase involved in cell wall biosynthesis